MQNTIRSPYMSKLAQQAVGPLSNAAASIAQPVNLEAVQRAKAAIQQELDRRQFMRSAGIGLAAGGGLAGAGLLFKTIAKSMQRNPSSYTAPIESVVYRPDRPNRRRRKVATSPLGPATQQLAGDDMMQFAKAAVPVAVALPVGFMAAKKLTDVVRGIARHNELQAAKQEFETALQEYAEAADQPRKIEQVVRKRAAMSERDVLMLCLAENCVVLSKTAAGGLVPTLGKGVMAYAMLAPLLAGVYGFNNRWDQRAGKDLDIAERQINIQREAVNPTFMVASLKDPPDRDGSTKDPADDQESEELRDAVAGGYNTDYL